MKPSLFSCQKDQWPKIIDSLPIDPKDIVAYELKIANQLDRDTSQMWAMGIFRLKDEHFILLRAQYKGNNSGEIREIESFCVKSLAKNREDALLELFNSMTEKEKGYLFVHLLVRDHPNYHG